MPFGLYLALCPDSVDVFLSGPLFPPTSFQYGHQWGGARLLPNNLLFSSKSGCVRRVCGGWSRYSGYVLSLCRVMSSESHAYFFFRDGTRSEVGSSKDTFQRPLC